MKKQVEKIYITLSSASDWMSSDGLAISGILVSLCVAILMGYLTYEH